MAQSEKFATYDKNLCRLCGNTTNTNQRLAIFSDYGNTINLQRLISDFAKVRVQEDDCFPNHLCRSCYRTLLNLRDKLLAFQTRCATTQVNLEEKKSSELGTHQNQALLPRFVVRKGRKRVAFKRKICPGKRYSTMKRKSHVSLQLQVTKSGRLIKTKCTFFVDQSYLSFQVAEISAQRSMVETTPKLSSNSSSITWKLHRLVKKKNR